MLRELLANAQRLLTADPKKKLPPPEAESLQRLRDDPAMVALAAHLKSGRPVVAHVQRADDIAALLRVQREFGLRLVVAGGAEAHVVATDLAAAQVPVILGPVRARPYDPANRRARDDAAAILAKAGVKLAIATADTHNARHLRWDAGFAVAHGLDWATALAAVTRNVADILGLAQGLRPATGTVTEGGPADLLVFDGDPLGLAAHLRLVVCGGQVEVDPRQR
ncbi:MAG: amidohydrolase family protein [Deltaproteobacteria bacterium]|nr:amidohydrolase family protein [Deltaproteobacteria bacterium]